MMNYLGEIPSGGYNALRTVLNPNDPDYLKKMGMVGTVEGQHELNASNTQPVDQYQQEANEDAMLLGQQPTQKNNKKYPTSSSAAPVMGRVSQPDNMAAPQMGAPAPVDPKLAGAPNPTKPHQGVLSKIGHGFETAGNIAGDIFAPSTMSLIPGTQLYGERQKAIQFQRNLEQERQNELELQQQSEADYKKALGQAAGKNADTKATDAATRQLSEEDKKAFDQGTLALKNSEAEYKQNIFDPAKNALAGRALDLRAQEIANQMKSLTAKIGLEGAQQAMLPYTYQLKIDALQLQTAIASSKNDQERSKLTEQYNQLKASHEVQDLLGTIGGLPELPQFQAPDYKQPAPLTAAGGKAPASDKTPTRPKGVPEGAHWDAKTRTWSM